MNSSEASLNLNSNLKKEQEYLLAESNGKSAGENSVWSKRLSTFPALQSKNYRIYFFGQLVSVIGTWLQIVAQGWLVLQLTNSPFLIGLVAALATTPSLLFSLFGGVIVDRFYKKRILFITQSLAMILALSLGILTNLNLVNVPVICTFAFLMGTVTAIDAPARQAFVSELVTREQLASAIALNSGIFNAGRVIGPGIAGLLIAVAGSGGAFIANGVSYIAVIVALFFLSIQEKPPVSNLHPIQAIKEGIQYSFSHPIIKVLLMFTAVISVFGWSYTTIMPVIARNVFHVEAKGLGYLYSATGLGSLLATYLVGAHSKRVSSTLFIIGGNAIFCLSLIAFANTTYLPTALFLLFFTGLGLLLQSSMMNTIIQGMVKNEFRGRVMSLYILMFMGLAPLGNFEIGWLTEHFGIRWAITINASIVLICGMILLWYQKNIREAYRNYKTLKEAEILV
ncbi:MFS transporter [Desertivirga brevis]|uniref:MFS transporter n=1 Tax=Desertivirga brevis TaxID=2810310 RepID=UPI001A97AFBE|nr:MFS transporter [Pedobacter sp. SYSU D00873]